MREPSRLRKAEEIIELAMMFQNSYCGLCIDDIQEHFECSRRSAERMKSLLFDLFPDKVEEVPTSDKKKRWRFAKGTMNFLISFTAMELANLMFLSELTNDESRKKVMNELHGLGMKFYLDDFGTGYSNFERIIDLPIDVIKFDRSLTLLAGKNLESRYLVGSFSEIFKKSEYQVLFEGVENAEDERICQDMQAHFLQGYKYSKPIPMEQLTEFLSPK